MAIPRRPLRLEPEVPIETRPLITEDEARSLADMFKVVANPTRLRLLHVLLRGDEVRVGDLATEVGMTPQAVSNQLQRLADKGIVESRRDGTTIHYRVVESCVHCLLEQGLCLLEERATRDGRPPA